MRYISCYFNHFLLLLSVEFISSFLFYSREFSCYFFIIYFIVFTAIGANFSPNPIFPYYNSSEVISSFKNYFAFIDFAILIAFFLIPFSISFSSIYSLVIDNSSSFSAIIFYSPKFYGYLYLLISIAS